MGFVKCFDVVDMVVSEATERFKPLFDPSEELLNGLRKCCDIIDDLADRHDGVSFDVEVDEIKMTIRVDLECADVTIEDANDSIYDVIRDIAKIEFSAGDDGNLLVSFTFPSIWVKA